MTDDKLNTFSNLVTEIVDEQLKELSLPASFGERFVDEILDYVLKQTPERMKDYFRK